EEEAALLGQWRRSRPAPALPTDAETRRRGDAENAPPASPLPLREGQGEGVQMDGAGNSSSGRGKASERAPALLVPVGMGGVSASPRPRVPASAAGGGPAGRGLWVWYAPRAGQLLDPTAATGRGLVAACRRANARWVAIKGGDPKSPRDGSWPQLSPDLVAQLR